jgi:hypothetical protein
MPGGAQIVTHGLGIPLPAREQMPQPVWGQIAAVLGDRPSHCPPGASTVTIMLDYGGRALDRSAMPDTTWPASDMTVEQVNSLPVDTLVVGTDGSTAAIEQARTVLDRSARYKPTNRACSTTTGGWPTSSSSPACPSPAAASRSASPAGSSNANGPLACSASPEHHSACYAASSAWKPPPRY